MSDYLLVLGVGFVAAALVMTVTAFTAVRAGRVSVVDTAWGIGLTLVAVLSAILGDGDPVRQWVLVGLVAAWGLRLSWHMHQRNHGKGEDPRYAKMLGEHPSLSILVRKVYLLQGVAIWFVALPVEVAALSDGTWSWLAWLGACLWLVGFLFEWIGDAQLAAYKRDPDRGPVLDTGLWAWTRHPNYFGDACVWWGIWLVALDGSWWVLLTVPAPIMMTYFLVWATGAKPLEKTMMKRPGYPEYAARTSFFFPSPHELAGLAPRTDRSGPTN